MGFGRLNFEDMSVGYLVVWRLYGDGSVIPGASILFVSNGKCKGFRKLNVMAYSWFQKTKLKDSQISTDLMILLISTHLLADDDDNDGNHAQNGNKAFRCWFSENLENWDPLFPGAHLLALRAICTQKIQQRVSKALSYKLYTCVSISSKSLGHHKSSGPKSLVYCKSKGDFAKICLRK